MRIVIEEATTNSEDVLNNLKQIEGVDRDDLVARLLDFENLETLKAEVNQELGFDQLKELISKVILVPGNIRDKLLNIQEQETLELV